MSRLTYAIAVAVLAAACQGVVAYAQQAAAPPFATTKVDGTDNVYVFRYGNHQSMFVVTSAGVIASAPTAWCESLRSRVMPLIALRRWVASIGPTGMSTKMFDTRFPRAIR